MKVKSFDRWHLDELDQFIALDGGSIKIRFITEFEYVIRIYYDEVLTYSVSYQPHQQNQYGAPTPYNGDWGQPTTPFSPHQTTQTGGNTTDRQPPYSSQSDNPQSNNDSSSNTITSSRPPQSFFISTDDYIIQSIDDYMAANPVRSRRRRQI